MGVNVLAHKKKLAPISISTPTEEKKENLTNSGSLVDGDMKITKDGIMTQNPKSYSEMSKDASNNNGNQTISKGKNLVRMEE